MKKVFAGILMLSMISTASFAADGGKKKKKKAKTECTTKCCDPKDCKKNPDCTPNPNCDPKDCKLEEKCAVSTTCSK